MLPYVDLFLRQPYLQQYGITLNYFILTNDAEEIKLHAGAPERV